MRVQRSKVSGQRGGRVTAFTLLEVMVAVAIFFMAAFAILGLVSQNVGAARRLQRSHLTAASLAAQMTISNKLEEGSSAGDFGDLYPGFSWMSETTLAMTNGLFQVEFAVMSQGKVESTMTILLYRPDSVVKPGASAFRGRTR
ncbi:MAG: hypothetical protein HY301_09610 [Verrucomicrobia bacterium]|nr:hypothetical protein [Verrucomicrobiota bacterium]